MLRPEYDPTGPTSVPVQSHDTGIGPAAPHAATPDPTTAAGQGHSLTVTVVGTPAPQGSHRAFVVKGRPVVTQDSKKTRPWREAVKAAVTQARTAWDHPLTHDVPTLPMVGPVELDICFYMPRPQAHFRTGKHAGLLKPTAPLWCDKRPDIDKCTRSTCDALTEAGVYRDDNQVVALSVQQQYTNTGVTGARITITPLTSSVPAPRPLPVAGAGTDTSPRRPAVEGEATNGRRDTTSWDDDDGRGLW